MAGGGEEGGADAEDRTEAPTPKRIERARSEGQVPLSRDAVGLATLLCATVVGMLALPAMGAEWLRAVRVALSAGAETDAIGAQSLAVLRVGLLAVLPVLLAVAVSAVAATMGQTGGLVHGKALAPSLSRLNPLAGFKRLFGLKGVAEVARGLAKMAFVGAAVWHALDFDALQAALHRPAGGLLDDFGAALLRLLLAASAALAIIAGADVAWARWRHMRQLRMSREDLRQETREALIGIRGDGRDWVACRMGVCDGVREAGWPTGPREEPWHHDRTGSGQPLGADRRRQVLRLGAPAPLAGGSVLSRLRQRIRGPGRL